MCLLPCEPAEWVAGSETLAPIEGLQFALLIHPQSVRNIGGVDAEHSSGCVVANRLRWALRRLAKDRRRRYGQRSAKSESKKAPPAGLKCGRNDSSWARTSYLAHRIPSCTFTQPKLHTRGPSCQNSSLAIPSAFQCATL